MQLEKEMETYKRKLPELTASAGKYALIHGDDFIDVFASYEDAIKDGYRRFGLAPFLVKQIQATEKVLFITRLLVPTPASTT